MAPALRYLSEMLERGHASSAPGWCRKAVSYFLEGLIGKLKGVNVYVTHLSCLQACCSKVIKATPNILNTPCDASLINGTLATRLMVVLP